MLLLTVNTGGRDGGGWVEGGLGRDDNNKKNDTDHILDLTKY